MQLEVLDINNKKYMVLNELTDDNETYVYLSNIKNPKDFVVRKVDKNDKEVLINLDNEEEFVKAMDLFREANKEQ